MWARRDQTVLLALVLIMVFADCSDVPLCDALKAKDIDVDVFSGTWYLMFAGASTIFKDFDQFRVIIDSKGDAKRMEWKTLGIKSDGTCEPETWFCRTTEKACEGGFDIYIVAYYNDYLVLYIPADEAMEVYTRKPATFLESVFDLPLDAREDIEKTCGNKGLSDAQFSKKFNEWTNETYSC